MKSRSSLSTTSSRLACTPAENLPDSWREPKGKREQSTDEALSQQSRLTQSPLPDCSLTDSDKDSPNGVLGFDEVWAQLGIQGLGVLIRGEPETNMHTGCKTDAHVQQEGGADEFESAGVSTLVARSLTAAGVGPAQHTAPSQPQGVGLRAKLVL